MAAPSPRVLITAAFILSVLLTTVLLYSGTSFTFPNLSHPSTFINHPSDTINRHLSASECMTRFPELYLEADRAKKWYRAKGGIRKEDVDDAERDDGQARLVILDNKLFVKGFYGSINSRTHAAMAAVYRTLLTSPEPLPDVDFVLQTGDGGAGEYPHFALDRAPEQEQLWLMPDFGFFSWPEPGIGAYTEVRADTRAYEAGLGYRENVSSSWEKKTRKLMWRGVPMVEVRQQLLRASHDQPWSDVKELNWGAINQDAEGREKNNGDLKTIPEHCQFAFLAHVEGWAYSGRLKYLQQCRSVIVTHPLRYIQHYHHLLNPDPNSSHQNVVEVPFPLEEHLPGVMEELLDEANADRVERIAENSWRDMREHWISPAANECYYRYALRAYASVQTFQPELEERSVPYESFLLMGTTHWDPHR